MKQYQSGYSHSAFLLLCVMSGRLAAQDVVADLYRPPTPPKVMAAAVYPAGAQAEGLEGVVEVDFMVDAKGKPFELVVVNSVGDKEFEQNTLDAVSRWTYAPAAINDQPIAGSQHVIMQFRLPGRVGPLPKFSAAYKKFIEEMKSLPQDEAKAALLSLEKSVKNLYENAFLNMARFMYAERYGSSLEQMAYLDAALSFSKTKFDQVYLINDAARDARRLLIKLQAKNNYFAEALTSYRYFESADDKESVAMFKPLIDQINELGKSDRSYELKAQLNKGGHFEVGLLKHKIFVANIDGKVDGFKVRCQKKFVGFSVEPEVAYDIPEAWGRCSLQVIGTSGTSLVVGQQ